jgi:hypothetical protein
MTGAVAPAPDGSAGPIAADPTAEGLGVLVTLAAELRCRGGGLVLVNVPADTYEVFAVTHLVDVLDVRPAFPP